MVKMEVSINMALCLYGSGIAMALYGLFNPLFAKMAFGIALVTVAIVNMFSD